MSLQSKGFGSWLEVVAGLLGSAKKVQPRRPVRRLLGERLERRSLLTVAPAAEVYADEGASLDEYLATEHVMGPIAPSVDPAASEAAESASDDSFVANIDPSIADQVFVFYPSAGEGEGEGEGSGSGSGSGSGLGSGSGGDETPPEVIEGDQSDNGDGTVTVTGTITDESNPTGWSISIISGSGSASIDENGNFTLTDGVPDGDGCIIISVTDANGNTTEYTIYV